MRKFVLQILLCVMLFVTLFLNLFVFNNSDTVFALIVVSTFLILSWLINGFRKPKKRGVDDVVLIITGLSVLLIALLYLTGIKAGFLISYNSILKNYIAKSAWFRVFAIVILTEIARYIVTQTPYREKIQKWLLDGVIFLGFFLIDLTIVSKSYDYTVFNQLYEFFALVFIQSVAKNLFLTYIARDFGFIPCLAYRLIIDLYSYFLPVVPNVNMFIESTILLIYPYVLYQLINKLMTSKVVEPVKKKQKVLDKIITSITTVIFVVLVALVSREFSYCMIAIGSESMTGTANKGDAIIYEKYERKKYKLKEADIIVFRKNNVTVVHRINEIISMDGESFYKTKGDFNESVDNWVVSKDDVVGVVKERIPYIGWPSVWLNEIF